MQRMSQNQSLISNCQVGFPEAPKHPISISEPESDDMNAMKCGQYKMKKLM